MADVASMVLLHKSANWWSDLILFVAGLSILIDLFEPTTLRRMGARARERANDARNIRKERRRVRNLTYARQDLLDSFVEVHPSLLSGRSSTRLRSEPVLRMPWKEELTEEEYLAFWRSVNDRLPSLHRRCNGDHGDVCPHQLEYILKQVDKFMKRRIGVATHETVLVSHRGVYEGLKLWRLPAALFISLAVYSTSVDADTTIQNVLRAALLVSLLVLQIKVFPGSLSAPLWSVVGGVLGWSGSQLDRRRPLHPFRIAAVALFVAGSLMKLIVEK